VRDPSDLVLRAEAGALSTFPALQLRVQRLGSPPEECESGRIGRSRKPLCLMGTVGSNPTSSATGPRWPVASLANARTAGRVPCWRYLVVPSTGKE
jgi:hypothetical protein